MMNASPIYAAAAAVAWKQSEPLKVEEIQVEPPKSTEVRIKMLYASMCATDITCWKGSIYVRNSFFVIKQTICAPYLFFSIY